MASDGIACRILIQNEQLEQVDTFPYLGSLITEDGECTTGAGDRGITTGSIEKLQHTDFNEDTTNKSAYGCESWTLRKNKDTRLDTFEMEKLRKILGFS